MAAKTYTYEGVIRVRHERRLAPAEGQRIGDREVSFEDVTVQLEVDVAKLLSSLGTKAARNSRGKSAVAVGVKAKVLARGKREVQP